MFDTVFVIWRHNEERGIYPFGSYEPLAIYSCRPVFGMRDLDARFWHMCKDFLSGF